MKSDALKDRMKIIAKQKGVSFNEIWKQLLLERFLARLSQSHHQKKFIFKGGLLLSQYLLIGRETTDADFLMTKLKSEIPVIETAFKEIIEIDLNDGFIFSWSHIEELTQPHMEYPGFRISLDARLEKMKDKIQIDIGVGDLVTAVENNLKLFEFKGRPIFDGEISLLTYPVETIFAEKLETIISKGATNSRMKDYHDIILMIREPQLIPFEKLQKTVQTTFENRGTQLNIPIKFDSDGIAILEKLWSRHLNGLGAFKSKLNLPDYTPSHNVFNPFARASSRHRSIRATPTPFPCQRESTYSLKISIGLAPMTDGSGSLCNK